MAGKSFIYGMVLVLTIAIELGSFPVVIYANTPEHLYQDGLYKETGLGDLQAAAKVYEEILVSYKDNRVIAAKAQWRLGICYFKMQNKQAAVKALRAVIDNFPDQKEIVKNAKEMLASIESDPDANSSGLASGVNSERTMPISIAILGFDGTDPDITKAMPELMASRLSESGLVKLVDRKKINDVLDELSLSMSGHVDSASVIKIGKIIGAQLMLTGSVIHLEGYRIINARLINVETTQVKAVEVREKVEEDILQLVNALSEKVLDLLRKEEGGALAKTPDVRREEKMENLKEAIKGFNLPRVSVIIPEYHLTQPIPDPAAEIQIKKRLIECGFELVEIPFTYKSSPITGERIARQVLGRPLERQASFSEDAIALLMKEDYSTIPDDICKDVDLLVIGEGISERAIRTGDFITCRARLEIKVVNLKYKRLLYSSSVHASGLDIAENIAAKDALRNCADKITSELVLQIAKKWETQKEKWELLATARKGNSAAVDKNKELKAYLSGKEMPRLAVFIAEYHIPHQTLVTLHLPDPAAENALKSILIDVGFKVTEVPLNKEKPRRRFWDRSSRRKSETQDSSAQEGNLSNIDFAGGIFLGRVVGNPPAGEMEVRERTIPESLAKLLQGDISVIPSRSQDKIDLVIAGEAFSEVNEIYADEVSCSARIEVKAYDLKSRQIIYSDSGHASGLEGSENISAKKALHNAGVEISDALARKIVEGWKSGKK